MIDTSPSIKYVYKKIYNITYIHIYILLCIMCITLNYISFILFYVVNVYTIIVLYKMKYFVKIKYHIDRDVYYNNSVTYSNELVKLIFTDFFE
jgi:hypothetical protein